MAKKKSLPAKTVKKPAKKAAAATKKVAKKAPAASVKMETVTLAELFGFSADEFKTVGELKTWITEELKELQHLLTFLGEFPPKQKLTDKIDIPAE